MKDKEVVLMSISRGELEEIITKCISNPNSKGTSTGNGEKLNQREAADFFGVVPLTIIRWRREGKIPFYQVGKKIYFIKEELIKVAQQDPTLTRKAS